MPRDTTHQNQSIFQCWIDNTWLKRLDSKIKKDGYKSRAEWFREVVRNYLKDGGKK